MTIGNGSDDVYWDEIYDVISFRIQNQKTWVFGRIVKRFGERYMKSISYCKQCFDDDYNDEYNLNQEIMGSINNV